MKHRIYVVGMGPGQENMMTQEAMQVLEASDVIIGYTVYLKLLGGTVRVQRIIVYTDAAGAGTLPDVFREGKRRQKSGIDLQRRCRNLRDGIPDAGNRKII